MRAKCEEIQQRMPLLPAMPLIIVLVDGADKIFNWSDGLAPYFSKTPTGNKSKFDIQQYVSIQFKPCGTLACSSSYLDVSQPFKYMITHPDEITLDPASPVPLKKAKIAGVHNIFVWVHERRKSEVL